MPRMERAGRTVAIGSGGLRQCKLEDGCQARANAPDNERRRIRRLHLNRQGSQPGWAETAERVRRSLPTKAA